MKIETAMMYLVTLLFMIVMMMSNILLDSLVLVIVFGFASIISIHLASKMLKEDREME